MGWIFHSYLKPFVVDIDPFRTFGSLLLISAGAKLNVLGCASLCFSWIIPVIDFQNWDRLLGWKEELPQWLAPWDASGLRGLLGLCTSSSGSFREECGRHRPWGKLCPSALLSLPVSEDTVSLCMWGNGGEERQLWQAAVSTQKPE